MSQAPFNLKCVHHLILDDQNSSCVWRAYVFMDQYRDVFIAPTICNPNEPLSFFYEHCYAFWPKLPGKMHYKVIDLRVHGVHDHVQHQDIPPELETSQLFTLKRMNQIEPSSIWGITKLGLGKPLARWEGQRAGLLRPLIQTHLEDRPNRFPAFRSSHIHEDFVASPAPHVTSDTFTDDMDFYDGQSRRELIQRIMNDTVKSMANDLVGVQPMSGPAGQVFALRSKYDAYDKLILNSIYGYPEKSTDIHFDE